MIPGLVRREAQGARGRTADESNASRMTPCAVRLFVLAVLLAVLACPTSPVGAKELTPEETVQKYLTAMKAGNFKEAYQYVSKAMAQGRSQDDWAKEQQWIFQMAEAKIFEFKTFPAKIKGDKAFVPNILSSQDKFLNQLGVEEHELYTLVREDNQWKINQQEDVERENLAEWFPQQKAK